MFYSLPSIISIKKIQKRKKIGKKIGKKYQT